MFWWGLIIIAVTLLEPTKAAAVSLPLPQDISYIALISAQIYGTNFATDPTLPSRPESVPVLSAVLVGSSSCIPEHRRLSYRLVVRNEGESIARDLFLTVHYPEGATLLKAERTPLQHHQEERSVIWVEPALAPGSVLAYTVIIDAASVPGDLETQAVVEYVAGKDRRLTQTSYTLSPCAPAAASRLLNPLSIFSTLWDAPGQ